MTAEPPPSPSRTDGNVTDAQSVVEAFMDALASAELDRAMSLLAEDVVYSNVGLPTIRGRNGVRSALKGLVRPAVGFEVCMHSISVDGPVVLTERTDVIVLGGFRAQFWVWGRFDVEHGLITLWRDSFDFVDVTRGLVRGLAGVLVPGLRPVMPAPEDPPGR